MKLTINSKDLLKSIQTVGSLIKPQNNIPILDNILMDIKPGKLFLTADNLEVRSVYELPVEFDNNHSVCIPYALLVNILKGLPSGPIELLFTEKNVTVKSSTGEYKIPINPEDVGAFPVSKVEDCDEKIIFNSLDLVEAIRKTLPFVEVDQLRPVLSSLLLWIGEEDTKVTGCTGHLFFEKTLQVKGAEKRLLISKTAATYLTGSIMTNEDLEVSYKGNHIFFKLSNRIISSVLSEGDYPQYQKNIEAVAATVNRSYKTDKDQIYPPLKRIVNVMDGSSKTLILDFAGTKLQMEYQSDAYEFNAKEDIDIDYEGEPLLIAFNSKSMENLISSIDGSLTIGFCSEKHPCLLTSEDTRALLGPYMLPVKEVTA